MKLFYKFQYYITKYFSGLLLTLFYSGNIWRLKEDCLKRKTNFRTLLYYSWFRKNGCYIGVEAILEEIPIFPHGLNGIFISNMAQIGKGAVIFQQVTIGSNNLQDSKRAGAPLIGKNAYIGAGAKIVGNVRIGDNVRIGANCVVYKDVPDNCVCVLKGLEIIQKDPLDNTYRNVMSNY